MRPTLPLLLLLLSACGQGGEEANASRADGQAPAAGPAKAAPAAGLDRSRAGSPAPATAFEDPDGDPATLADFRGKPLLLNLWATWCAPCIAEMPTLDALAERQKGQLQVVTISQDLDGRDKVEAFFEKQGYRNLETWLDPQMALMGEMDAKMLPVTILYDSDGRELWRVIGPDDWGSERAAALIAEAMRSRR